MSRQKSDAKIKKPKPHKPRSPKKGTAGAGDAQRATTSAPSKQPAARSAAKRPLPAGADAARPSVPQRRTSSPQKGAASRLNAGHVYADVLAFLANFESQLGGGGDLRQTFDAEALEQLQRALPGIPADYVAYLREVGWGSFMRCQYTVYRHLMPAAERFGKHVATRLERRVLCFGDSLSGDVAGFLPDQDWAIVEIGQLDFSIHPTGQTFGEFIREQMGLDENGG